MKEAIGLLNDERRTFSDLCRAELEKFMIEEAAKQDLVGMHRQPFKKPQHVSDYWATTDPNDPEDVKTKAASVYQIIQENFDKSPGWEERIEEMVMKELKYKYLPDEKDHTFFGVKQSKYRCKKGCVAKLIAVVKANFVKRVLWKGKQRHGIYLSKKRKEKPAGENAYKRRCKMDNSFLSSAVLDLTNAKVSTKIFGVIFFWRQFFFNTE